ncbi:MAG: class I SAM-dependent methyltransferase [Spirochaetales bacterium]|nr:class I SAM-dependent methyltransferase [Spirochaetales bacterium]
MIDKRHPAAVFLEDVCTDMQKLAAACSRFVKAYGPSGAFRLASRYEDTGKREQPLWYAEVHAGLLFAVVYGRGQTDPCTDSAEWGSAFSDWFMKGPVSWGLKGGVLQYRTRKTAALIAGAGDVPGELTVCEDGLFYRLMPCRGMNPGLFLDSRNARGFVRENAAGRRVLNLFSYTCAFSVAAVAGGAAGVVNVDMKGPFLDWGRENHRLNGLDPGGVRFEKLDVMKSFGRLERHGPYGMIICDPPSFQGESFTRSKDAPRLLRRVAPMVEPGGLLLVLINDAAARPDYAWELVQGLENREGESISFETLASIAPCPDFGKKGTRGSVFRRTG